MFKRKWGRRAQSFVEYAVLIGVITAGLVAMQVYLKRSLQGKVREGADSLGEAFSPDYTTHNYVTTSSSDTTETVGGGVTTTTINSQTTTRSGKETVANLDKETLFK